MGMRLVFVSFLSLFIFGCASQQAPTGKAEDWVTVVDGANKPVAGFDKTTGDVKLYTSGETAFRTMVGMMSNYVKECPCCKKAEAPKADKKAKKAKVEKKAEVAPEKPVTEPPPLLPEKK